MAEAPLRVLAVSSELFPLVKTGGLADAAGALPLALAAEGVAVDSLLPGYPAVRRALTSATTVATLPDLFGAEARILAARHGGLSLRVLDAPHLFDRPGGPYQGQDGRDWPDNALRFAALSRAAAALVLQEGHNALHAHDWQAGLAPAYLRFAPRRVPSLFTIHNLAFQGRYPAALFPALGLPPAAMAVDGLEYYGGIGFLKAGLWFADAINTVSPSYAEEILTPGGGMGLDGLLRGRAGALHGILNGLDTESWNPATDPDLAARFDAGDPTPRAVNKAALRARAGLTAAPAAPLIAFVGRLTWQKGADLLLRALPMLLEQGAQLFILGSGEAELEAACSAAAKAHPGKVASVISFDEGLARLTYGGADALVVPSRFEPCGLAQLAALRYGAPPVVSRTGGLSDTVIDASPMALAAGVATGVQFAPGSAEALMAALRRTLQLIRDPVSWDRIRNNAMATDVSWGPSARRYAALLRGIAARHE